MTGIRSLLLWALPVCAAFLHAAGAPAPARADPPAPAQGVVVRIEPLTLPYDRLRKVAAPLPPYLPRADAPDSAASQAVGETGGPADSGARPPRLPTVPHRMGELTFTSVVLENAYLRVRVIPEVGGVIESAQFKPTGDEFFMRERRYKQWWPWWESGVKLSFPFAEHGCVLLEQPASWRVQRYADGRVTVAMWMEFSRWNAGSYPAWPRRSAGGYARIDKKTGAHVVPWFGHSSQLVTQMVTLSPNSAVLSVTYRLVNPAPYRQGRRLWNTAFLSRYHTQAGAVLDGGPVPQQPCDAELIFPCHYKSTHNGAGFGRVADFDLAGWARGKAYSLFSWNLALGFCGLYYPQVDVNRLRLHDANGPGTKFWYDGYEPYDPSPANFRANVANGVELWGGFDNLFEGVERWNRPGEADTFTNRWAIVRGIGKAQFANSQVAFAASRHDGALRLGVVPLSPACVEVRWDGAPVGEAQGGAPDKPAFFDLPADQGRLSVLCDGREAYAGPYPVAPPDNAGENERVRQALSGPYSREMAANGKSYGEAGIGGGSILRYAPGTTDQGRIEYRLGYVQRAQATLEAATTRDADDGEGWHLLGACHLEEGRSGEAARCLDRALGAKRAYPAAGYYRALIAIGAGDRAMALRMLDELVRVSPQHWEARLLRTWLLTQEEPTQEQALTAARELVDEDPADPRASRVLLEALYRTSDRDNRELEALEEWKAFYQLQQEPGAQQRVKEFLAAAQGRFVPAARIGLADARP
jgi:tetratricopeptide (TPR) repeat protein